MYKQNCRYSALEALEILQLMEDRYAKISLHDLIIDTFPACSVLDQRDLYHVLKNSSSKGFFPAVYCVGMYTFMIYWDQSNFHIVDNHQVPSKCGGTDNAVIVTGSLVGICSWLWKRLENLHISS